MKRLEAGRDYCLQFSVDFDWFHLGAEPAGRAENEEAERNEGLNPETVDSRIIVLPHRPICTHFYQDCEFELEFGLMDPFTGKVCPGGDRVAQSWSDSSLLPSRPT